MRCEEANPLLVEYAERELPPGRLLEIEEHMTDCERCQADFAAITEWRTMSASWHDETPPAWQPIKMPGRDYLDSFRQWFPTFASAAALAMVAILYVQPPADANGTLPQGQPAATDYSNLPPLPQATQAAMVESVMEGSREQRQEELQALLKILKAEMDRRSIETEESMRYIISHQIQGQQELDDLYRQVEELMASDGTTTQANPEGSP